MIKNIAIVGVGLIGGSIALDAKARGLADEVLGIDSNKHHLKDALDLKIIDRAAELENLGNVDFIVISVPPSNIAKVLEQLANIAPNSIIADVGSVKKPIVEKAKQLNCSNFVAAHPIAGTENFGPRSAKKNLFEGAFCILTPYKGQNKNAFEVTATFFKQLGMKVLTMEPELHDRVFGYVSHLPHAVAYSLVSLIAKKDSNYRFFGGGFRDFTRIAASSEDMWGDIFIMNKENILDSINEFCEELNKIKYYISNNEKESLKKHLKGIRNLKRSL